ncbi:MAG: hypothetical protein R3A13_10380 [Bdellovibrionota bacterium]
MQKNIVLIFFIWLSLVIFINQSDLTAYNLQQAGVEAIVERGTFSLKETETPAFKNPGDSFYHKDWQLPAKQPGQFILGAIPYFFLEKLGLSYRSNLIATSWLVTALSTTLLAALCIFLVYSLCFEIWNCSPQSSLIAAFSFGFGTHFLPYSGVMHHDIICTFFLFAAVYFIEKIRLKKGQGGSLFVGLLLSFAASSSGLSAVVILALGLYAIYQFNWNNRRQLILGALLGILPLFAYNYYYFGNILVQGNVAGNFSDTFPVLDFNKIIESASNYTYKGTISLIWYAPITLLAISYPIFRKNNSVPAFFLLLLCLLHLFFVASLETVGHCQTGPRYLLPLLPFAIAPLAGLLDLVNKSRFNKFIFLIFALIAGYSLITNSVSAIYGTMYCDILDHTVLKYAAKHGVLNLGIEASARIFILVLVFSSASRSLKELEIKL